MWKLCLFSVTLFFGSLNANTDLSSEEVKLNQFEACLLSSGTTEGIIFRESGPAYDKLNWQWNAVNGDVDPMAYVVAKETKDVQNAVICSKSSGVRIVPRSGGHSYLKYGFGDSHSVVIDLSHLNQVIPDPEHMTVEIGPGARAGHVSSTLFANGEYMTTTALNPSVGSGGVTLGGGYGHFARLYGLASDNLIELEMVDANGTLLLINENENSDLFWALRGSGGGSFGIVTKMKLKMFKAPKSIAYSSINFNLDDFPQFYDAWQSLITSPDDLENMSGYVLMYHGLIDMRIFYLCSELENHDAAVARIERLLESFGFPKVIINSVELLSYPEFVLNDVRPQYKSEIKEFAELSGIDEFVGWKKIKSFYVDKLLNKNEIDQFNALIEPFMKYGTWHFEMNGGAINNFNSNETAFVHRGNNMFHVQLKFIDGTGDDDLHVAGVSAMNTFYEKSKEILNHTESYQNYLDGDITDYLQRYYGSNLERLIQIKIKYDPENVFHHPRSIPTTL